MKAVIKQFENKNNFLLSVCFILVGPRTFLVIVNDVIIEYWKKGKDKFVTKTYSWAENE